MENFNHKYMTGINVAAANLCSWVKAIEEFAQALKVVIPKKEKKEVEKEENDLKGRVTFHLGNPCTYLSERSGGILCKSSTPSLPHLHVFKRRGGF